MRTKKKKEVKNIFFKKEMTILIFFFFVVVYLFACFTVFADLYTHPTLINKNKKKRKNIYVLLRQANQDSMIAGWLQKIK